MTEPMAPAPEMAPDSAAAPPVAAAELEGRDICVFGQAIAVTVLAGVIAGPAVGAQILGRQPDRANTSFL